MALYDVDVVPMWWQYIVVKIELHTSGSSQNLKQNTKWLLWLYHCNAKVKGTVPEIKERKGISQKLMNFHEH